MQFFKDHKENPIYQINQENLADFKKFLSTLDSRDDIDVRPIASNGVRSRVNFEDNISFDDLTKDENGKSIHFPENIQKYLGRLMYQSSEVKDYALAAIDNADDYPLIIATLHNDAGYDNGSLYAFIRDTIGKRKLSENLAVIDALVSNTLGYELYNLGQPDKIPNLSGNQKKHLEHIYSLGKKLALSRSSENYKYYPAFQAITRMGKEDTFINCNLSPDLRNEFNNAYFEDTDTLYHRISVLDKKHFRAEDVATILYSGIYRAFPRTNKDTSNARTQAEKNVNIIPEHYKKIKSLILELAENENSYISGLCGETKSLVQKVQSLAVKLQNMAYDQRKARGYNLSTPKAQSWEMLSSDFKSGILQDVLLEAAQKEIINGNAAKLDAKILQIVLSKDKDAYYSEKIPNEILKNIQLTNKQAAKKRITQAKKTYDLYGIEHFPLSTQEKSTMIDNVEKALQPNLARKAELEQLKEEYKKDAEKVSKSTTEYNEAHRTASDITSLQEAYQKITKQLKDGEPNKNETHLIQQEVEKIISSSLAGNGASIRLPEQGSLPLFGRGKEKERRSELDRAIRSFNDVLRDVADTGGLKAFSGRLLTPEAKEEAARNEAMQSEKYNKIWKQWENASNFKYSNYSNEMRDLDNITTVEQAIKEKREVVQKHLEDVRKKAKDEIGVPKTSTLQAVRKDMDKDTKTAVRRKNKSVTDKLADKAALKAKKQTSR